MNACHGCPHTSKNILILVWLLRLRTAKLHVNSTNVMGPVYSPISTVPWPADVTVSPWWLCRSETPDRSWFVCRLKEERRERGLRPPTPQSGSEAESAGSSAVRSARKAPESMLNTESGRRKNESHGHESYSRGLDGYFRGSSCSKDELRRSRPGTTSEDEEEFEVDGVVACVALNTLRGTADTDADLGMASLAHNTISSLTRIPSSTEDPYLHRCLFLTRGFRTTYHFKVN